MVWDSIVIGGGVVGAACARYLSLYNMSVLLLEKNEDISSETTKANSGIVHAGYDPIPGTMKARMNIRGSQLIREEHLRLGFDYKENGALVVSFSTSDDSKIDALYKRGKENGVEGMEILTGEEARRIEPLLSESVTSALHLKTSGIVCPFTLTQALSENAVANGAEFKFNSKVISIKRKDGSYSVSLESGETLETRSIVNAAGLYADEINNMVSLHSLHITPRRGNYMLFDAETKGMFTSTIFQLPTEKGKGVLVTPTVHGNLMIGPTGVIQDDKEDTSTYSEDLDAIVADAGRTTSHIPMRKVITSFSGLRAHEDGDDFVIGEIEDAPLFFNAAGIESPGLSSAMAIGEYLSSLVAGKLKAEKKENPILEREKPIRAKELSKEDRTLLVKKNPSYGKIVCRCEGISEGEIIDAITRPLGARSLDGVKRRVRAGMGRCQGGFCSPRVMELLEEYGKVDIKKVSKNNRGSEISGGER